MKDKNRFLTQGINDTISSINPNSIIGNPIKISDSLTVIPIIKSTSVFLGGGGEYGEVKLFSKANSHPFAGGSGTLVNTIPCGFLVCKEGECSYISVPENFSEKLFDKSLETLKKAMNNEN